MSDPYQLHKSNQCDGCADVGIKRITETTRCVSCLHEFCAECLPEHDCEDYSEWEDSEDE